MVTVIYHFCGSINTYSKKRWSYDDFDKFHQRIIINIEWVNTPR